MEPIGLLHRAPLRGSGRCVGGTRIAGAAVLLWLAAGTGADAQTGAGGAYDPTAATEAICRQYAAAVTGMPPGAMFEQCMSERHCRISAGRAGYQCAPSEPMSWHGGGY